MDRSELLARARAFAEEGMVDTCTIRRRNGETLDPHTAETVPTYDLIYQGKCRVQMTIAQAQQQNAGEAHLLMVRLEVQLPMSATGIEPEDETTIDTSRDPDLVGRIFIVRDLFHKTDATSRRIGVLERTS